MYELFEHTADLGLRIRAATLPELFAESAQALFSAVVADLASIRPVQTLEVVRTGDAWDFLLFDWLNELLYRFDAEHLIFGQFRVRFEGNTLIGEALGEPIDRDRHLLEHEIKAITYHGLRVEKGLDGWEAEIIVDI